MGADSRLFSNVEPIDGFEFVDMNWKLIKEAKSLKEYANKIAGEIDTSSSYSLLGVSLGGMICVELADILNPENVVIISSAKTKHELPGHLTKLKYTGVQHLLNGNMVQKMVSNSSRFFGKMDASEKQLFIQMVEEMDMEFIKWSLNALLKWKRKDFSSQIHHLHGTSDFVIPYKGLKNVKPVHRGDHMMIWNRSDLVNEELFTIFKGSLKSDI